MSCTHWLPTTGPCGSTPARPYVTGLCCPAHTPAAVAGRTASTPDPDRALDALQRRARSDRPS